MRTVFYTASSLDGFLATADDDVGFLEEVPQPSKDTYGPFIERVGAICMGAATFNFLLRHVKAGGDWPYTQPVWVFTHQQLAAPDGADVHFVQGPVQDVHAQMVEVCNGKDLWVCGGGDLAGQFLDAGLLDALIVTVAARTLSSGKPLLPRDAAWRFESATMLGEGFVELCLVPADAPHL